METGVLVVPKKDIKAFLGLYDRMMDDLSPDCIWVPDRFLSQDLSNLKRFLGHTEPQSPQVFLDPFIAIAAMVSRQKGNRFGVAVTDFVRRAAPDLARTANTLTQWIGSPLNFGVGSGESINLIPLDYQHGTTPVSLMESQLEKFRAINDRGTFLASNGETIELGYHHFPSRIWMGGQRDRMLKIAAKYADGWLPVWHMSAQEYQQKAQTIRHLAADAGRPAPILGMLTAVLIGESKQSFYKQFGSDVLARTGALELSAEVWEKWGLTHPFGKQAKGMPDVIVKNAAPEEIYKALESVPQDYLNEACIFGSMDDVLSELWAYKEAGLEHLALMVAAEGGPNDSFFSRTFYSELKTIFHEVKKW